MARIYNENRRGLGVGLSAFYNQILLTHLNIQKRYTDNFLRSKGNYQIAKTPVRKVVRPITAKVPNERWMMDLIDMRSQIQQRYILTVVDVFSNYLFATIILNKTGQTIVERLQNFHNRTLLQGGSQGVYPRLLQSDQGSEFKISKWGAVSLRQVCRCSCGGVNECGGEDVPNVTTTSVLLR